MRKPKLAVWKFASCDGCQLTLLGCEDELLALAQSVEIAYFLEATRQTLPPPYDISLVEGSITTVEERRRIRQIRQDSRLLVTIGACATAGGIQALRNFADVDEYRALVYPHPEFVNTLAQSTAIADHVHVDYELRGCPIDKTQLLHVIRSLLHGAKPLLPAYSVCFECKRAGIPCVMVTGETACLGPVTHAGCGAICPAYRRGCYGCFGPKEDANTRAFSTYLCQNLGIEPEAVERHFLSYNANAERFRQVRTDHAFTHDKS